MNKNLNPFQVNDLALCMDVNWLPDSKKYAYQVKRWPQLWEFYTVRRIANDSIYLDEVVNPIMYDDKGGSMGEPMFWHKHFIKVEMDENMLEVYKTTKVEVLSRK
ncbi:MAG: hypothetical protein O2887_08080 [Bacteroidetes bacterium]|nr:hypothetical protein [Bacteroidota bacterium]MDA1120437.1 hypothetical protein [Bacteroidota bacterium]